MFIFHYFQTLFDFDIKNNLQRSEIKRFLVIFFGSFIFKIKPYLEISQKCLEIMNHLFRFSEHYFLECIDDLIDYF